MIDSRSSDIMQSFQTARIVSYQQVIFLRESNVIHYQSKLQSRYKCLLMGIIWKFIPVFRFSKRDFIIVD
jgi:hypothetical protein